jgi:MinD superfamily P-loop ATPase
VIETGQSDGFEFIHGKLNIGEAMPSPLIRAVKEYINLTKLTIIDVPPGTSCPVIEAIKGSNFCLLVTEPTPFGLNDLVLAVEVVRELKIAFGVIINKADVGDKEVINYCQKENIPILMEIPMDKRIAQSYSIGMPLVERLPEWKEKFKELYKKVAKYVR